MKANQAPDPRAAGDGGVFSPQRTAGRDSFPLFVAGQTSSHFAYHMLTVAIGWQMYDLTLSPLSLGFVGLAQFLPQFLLTLLVGYVADRYDRRRVVMICQLIECAVVSVLAAGSMSHWLTPRIILACAFMNGAARAFESPTMQALLPTVVEPARLPKCLALAASGRQAGFILGPALGGLLYAFGAQWAYIPSATVFFLACLCVAAIRTPLARTRREPPTFASIFDGIAYIKKKPVILGAISLDLFSVLLGGTTALLPIYARDILATGPWGLGLLRAAPAVGALSMSLYLARRPLRRKVGRIMFAAVAVFGLTIVVFGLSRSLPLSLAALVVQGSADMISVVVRSSLVQLETPDEMRGRVSAVNAVFIGTSNQLGEFESGVTAAWLGTVPAVVVGGICTLVVVGLWMRIFPALRDRETLVSRVA